MESKYKYKSSLKSQEVLDEEDEDVDYGESTTACIDESVVEKFIRVVEVRNSSTHPRGPLEGLSATAKRASAVPETARRATREDIRKKLAFGGPSSAEATGGERANGYKRGFQQETSDLEICFINESHLSDDEEGAGGDLQAEAKRGDEVEEDSSLDYLSGDEQLDDCAFPSSKAAWESLRSAAELDAASPLFEEVQEDRRRREELRRRALKKRLDQLQKEVKLNLLDCRQIARRQIEKAKQKRLSDDPLRKLIGLAPATPGGRGTFKADTLQTLNIAKLQLIVNHYHSQAEKLNEELVRQLLTKDELQIEQDGQLVDIEDLSCSFRLDY